MENQVKNSKEIYSGLALLVCAVVALIWANSPFFSTYDAIWHAPLGFLSIHQWVNDGLMTLFFLYVGIEIKAELQHGEMSTLKKAFLPVAAALGGMILPAIIYVYINQSSGGMSGWGIPMATDIAFATAILSMMKRFVSPQLKTFLTAFAIVDDLGAIVVIALFYTASISLLALGVGCLILIIVGGLNRLGIRSPFVYLILGLSLWFSFFRSGVHPTIAGVLFAMVLPSTLNDVLEPRLSAWVSYGIMPIFAFANAGVHFSNEGMFGAISLGIVCGLVIGKQFGITLFSWIAVKLKFAELPKETSWKDIYGVACLGGIGFTVSLFITQLAFTDAAFVSEAKLGILVGSLISAFLGFIILRGFFTRDAASLFRSFRS